jgi:predicted ribosome quality control (RQC) complex YloA/Tae2 family protein
MASSDRFSELEQRIMRTIEILKLTRHEKERIEKELLNAKSQVKQLERELDQLRRERDLVKNKVESLLENLSEIGEESVV